MHEPASALALDLSDETKGAPPREQVTIINFTVTMSGLEDQLLVDVIKNERPDLEAKKDELVSHRDFKRLVCSENAMRLKIHVFLFVRYNKGPILGPLLQEFALHHTGLCQSYAVTLRQRNSSALNPFSILGLAFYHRRLTQDYDPPLALNLQSKRERSTLCKKSDT